MARYIDADALIEKIDKEQTALETNNSVLWEINRKYWKGLAMARAIIDEQPTASVAPRAEWISVKERLPEESGMYLVFTYRGNRTVLDYSERHKTFNSFDSFSTEEANEVAIAVTHWMHLPEPPKGD